MSRSHSVLFIDHYDSFSFNLIDWLKTASPLLNVISVNHDDQRAMNQWSHSPMPILVSPGPKSPKNSPLTMQVLRDQLGKVPILGVCLGHQMLSTILGANLKRCKSAFHGSVKDIQVSGKSQVFATQKIRMATYNSLTVDFPAPLAKKLVTGTSANGEVEIIEYFPENGYPAVGVQFHPESFLSEQSHFLRSFFWQEIQKFYGFHQSLLANPGS